MTFNLSQVGVPGQLIDGSEGGDVGPDGHLMSVAELQAALRFARSGGVTERPSIPPADTHSTPQASTAQPESSRPEEPVPPGPPSWIQDVPQVEDSSWFGSVATDNHDNDSPTDKPLRRRFARAKKVKPESAEHEPLSASGDFEVEKAPASFGAVLGRFLIYGAAILIFISGFNQLVLRRILGSNDASAATAAIVQTDTAAAQQAATVFVAKYLNFDPTMPTGSSQIAGDSLEKGTDQGRLQWTGSDFLRADMVIPGAVVQIDDTRSVVSVQAQVTIAIPDATASPAAATSSAASETSSGAAAETNEADAAESAATPTAAANSTAEPTDLPAPAMAQAAIPEGFTSLGTEWVSLQVPVVLIDGRMVISIGGPVFSNDAVTVNPARTDAAPDPALTEVTRPVASNFFRAYGDSDVAYLAAPDARFNGAGGTVSLTKLIEWTLQNPSAESGRQDGIANVQWQLTGSDLSITQRYSLTVTESEGRWYAASLGPVQ